MTTLHERLPSRSLYALLIAVSAGSALLGFVREASIGALHGASRGTDAYYAALTIPFTAAYFLVGGALAPALTAALARHFAMGDRDAAGALFARSLRSFVLAGGFSAVTLAFLAPHAARFIVPGFDAAGIVLTGRLLRILVLYGALTSLGQLVTAGLIAAGAYRTAPLAVLAGNAVSLLVLLLPSGRASIESAAWAMNAGSAVFLIGLLPRAFSLGLLAQRPLASARVPWREAATLTLSLCAAGGVDLAERPFASTAGVGAIALLAFASKLIHLPMRLFAAPLASVVLPRFARSRVRPPGPSDEAGETASWVLRFLLYAAVLTAGAAAPLAALAFGRGHFDAAAVAALGRVLALLSPAIVFIGFIELASKLLVASDRVRAVAWAQGAGLLAYLVAAPALRAQGVTGLAIARDIAWGVAALGLALPLLRPHTSLRPFRRFGTSVLAACVTLPVAVLAVHLPVSRSNLLACVAAGGLSAAAFSLILMGGPLMARIRNGQRP
ncbi:MAG: oligosaccharide flippase family protein [Thermoanaerobaculia bacterium]